MDPIKKINNILGEIKPERYIELYELLNNDCFPFSETKIDHYEFNYWKSKGLTPTLPQLKKHQKIHFSFNLTDYIWIMLLKDMRDLGVPVRILLKIRDEMYDNISIQEVLDSLNKIKETAFKKINEVKLSELFEKIDSMDFNNEQKETFKKSLLEKKVPSIIDDYKITFSKLQSMIISAIENRQEVGILICNDGTFGPFFEEFFDFGVSFADLFYAPHVYVSIKNHIFKFLSDENKDKFINRFSLLTHEEQEIIRHLKDKAVKSIEICKPQDNTKNLILKIKIPKKIKQDDTNAIAKYLEINKFQSIEIKKGNDGYIHIEINKTKKI
jgi:ribose 5-phosphate isomerase RpiB